MPHTVPQRGRQTRREAPRRRAHRHSVIRRKYRTAARARVIRKRALRNGGERAVQRNDGGGGGDVGWLLRLQ